MKSVFADSYYFLALVNPGDAAHGIALAASKSPSGNIVTTAWIMAEVADAMSNIKWRRAFLSLYDDLRRDPYVELIPPSQELLDAGVELFRKRPDKDWSLTDCISFVVMKRRRISQALTGDRHFKQAGFKPLLA